jgi:hypothetical protein
MLQNKTFKMCSKQVNRVRIITDADTIIKGERGEVKKVKWFWVTKEAKLCLLGSWSLVILHKLIPWCIFWLPQV